MPESREQRNEVASARAAMNQLMNLADSSRYGERPDPDIALQFAHVLRKPLSRQLALFFEVKLDTITFEGIRVAGSDLVSRQLATILFDAGLRGFQIDPEATVEELARLGVLLATNWSRQAAFDLDFEATAWKLGLRSVHLDVFQPGLQHTESLVDLHDPELVARLQRQLGADIPRQVGAGLTREISTVLRSLRRLPDEAIDPPKPLDLEAEALRPLARMLAAVREDRDATIDEIALVIFECLRNDPGGIGAAETARRLTRHVRALLAAGAPEPAANLLRRSMSLVDSTHFGDFKHRQAIEGELQTLLGDRGREAIAQGVRHEGTRPEDWKGFLFTLAHLARPRTIRTLLVLGEVLPHRCQLQAVADTLVVHVDHHALELKQLLAEAHGEEAVIVLLALARRPDATLLEPILARMMAPEARVRLAALLALRDHRSKRVSEVTRRAAEDVDLDVRMEALRYLSVYRDAEAGTQLMERLRQIGPEDADEHELRAIAMTIGHVMRQNSVPDLRSLAIGQHQSNHPRAHVAALYGLKAAGPSGQATLGAIGRNQPQLRDVVRKVEGGQPQ